MSPAKTKSMIVCAMAGVGLAVFTGAATPGAAAADDEKAIKQVIESHVAAFHKRDVDANLSHWVKAPYVSHTYVGPNTGYVRGFDKLSATVREYMAANPQPTKNEVRLTDFIIRVNGNAAWVTFVHDQYEGGKRKSGNYEARYLEKVKGVWKIAAVVAKPSDPPAPKTASVTPAAGGGR